MAPALTTSQPIGQRWLPLPLPVVAGLVMAAAALALLPPPLNLAAALGVAIAVVTLLRPTWALYLVILSVPVQDVGAARVGGVAITATKVLVPMALAAWLVLRLTRGRFQFARSWLTLPYIAFVAALGASSLNALNQMVALTETARWLQALGIFLMTLDVIRSRRDLFGLVGALLLGGAFQAGVGLAQTTIGAGPTSFLLGPGASRAFGTFGMPNSYAGYLEMSFPLALALGIWLAGRFVLRLPPLAAPRARQLWWLAVPGSAALLLAGILASYSRGAWLGTLAGMAVMVAVAGRRSLAIRLVGTLFVGSLSALGGDALLPADITSRLGSVAASLQIQDVRRMVITPENWAVAERLAMWQAGLAMFDAQPITGIGAANFDIAYPRYRVPQFLYSRGHAHNYYIHVAAEAGMIGLAAYALVLIAAWVEIGRALVRLREPLLRALVVGSAGILAAVMVHNVFENLHVLNMNIHLFAALALPALCLRVSESRPEPTGAPTPPR